MSETSKKVVKVNCFVEADHAGDVVSRRSHTDILLYVNIASVIWYSKQQKFLETSTFGLESTALKIATKRIEGLRYILRMFGVHIDGPANVFGDNQPVINNTTIPESPLRKKHVAICYHRVREACASGLIRNAKENSRTKLTDILTKSLDSQKQKCLPDLIVKHS